MREATTRSLDHGIKATDEPVALCFRSWRKAKEAICLLRASFRFLPISSRYHLAMSQRLPRHLLSESHSRFHPPLATCVLTLEGRRNALLVCPRYKCTVASRLCPLSSRNESRIHGPATCDITGPSGHSRVFVATLYFVNTFLFVTKKRTQTRFRRNPYYSCRSKKRRNSWFR